MLFCADSSAKRCAVAHERLGKGSEVMLLFAGNGVDGRVVTLLAMVASLDLNDEDGSFLKRDYIRFETTCFPVCVNY
jgi:hypothetical protein